MHHHKWNMEYIDNLIPFEKEIYVHLLIKFLQEEERRYKDKQASNG